MPGAAARQLMVKLVRSKIDIAAYVLIAIFVLFLIVFGLKVHIIETNGAEIQSAASIEIRNGK